VKSKYSARTNQLIARAIDDASVFMKSVTQRDTALLESLNAKPEVDGWHLGRIANNLGYSANEHGRISFAQYIGASIHNANLADCWQAYCLEANYQERLSIHIAKQVGTPVQLFDQFSIRWIDSDVCTLAFAVWQLYAVGHELPIRDMACMFELFDLRQDVTHLNLTEEQLQAYDICVCVSLLIAKQDASVAAVNKRLGELPVFKGIADFWDDDEGFARFTERAAQWFLDYSAKHEGKFGSFAETAADVLVPSWIFALDTFRQKHHQRPRSIGQHELLEIGQRVLDGAKAQTHPKLHTLVAAQAHYEKLFGTEPFNPVPFWEKFLGVES
jgi:hypothetical protein